MSRYIEGFIALPTWEVPADHVFKTKITIIIPVRDEEKNIKQCLESILNNPFPKDLLEIIVINDHSTDRTPEVVQSIHSPNVKLLHLSDFIPPNSTQSFKKKGIEIAINQSSGSLILTTDGDCVVNKNWLPLMVSYYEIHQSKFIAAPVSFYNEQSNFEKFQSLDFTGMIALTGASIHRNMMNMCNGANLAYTKEVFNEVGGFTGIDQKASGDDMMLMQKVAHLYPNDIGFVKNEQASTYTTAKSTLKEFYHQRIRWSSKSTSYSEWQVTLYLGMVWAFCASISTSVLLSVFFGYKMLILAAIQWLVKIIIDYIFLGMSSRFFNRSDLMKSYWISAIYHLIYITLIGALGAVIKKYEWKGRTVE